jgi:hypothetical protein
MAFRLAEAIVAGLYEIIVAVNIRLFHFEQPEPKDVTCRLWSSLSV